MRLGPDASLFQQRVQEADISGNIDNPEGGFDGLVQVGIIAGDLTVMITKLILNHFA